MNRSENLAEITIKEAVQACCILLIILFVTVVGAQQIERSSLYRKSAFLSSIVSRDSIDLGSLVSTRQNLSLVQKFLAAVTDAYINFELIPVNEANTFAAIYESLNSEIEVERFAYQRKNLTIYGRAETLDGYRHFARDLRDTGHFEGVAGHYYLATDDAIRFELECTAANAVAAYLPQ